MKAVRFESGQVVVRDVPRPEGPDVLVRVRACGICGSDQTILDLGFPIHGIPGHEIAGELEDGTAVAIEPIHPCGACIACSDGDYQVCRTGNERIIGIGLDGGMAEYVRVPKRTLVPLPNGLDPRTACLVEPLAVALHGVRRADLSGSSKVLIQGGGSIGLCVAAAATSSGIEVDLVARHAAQIAAAERLGANVIESGSGGDYDVVLDCAGTDSAGKAACESLRPRGQMILLAPSWGDVVLPGMLLAAKELELRVSMMYGRRGAARDVDVAALILAQRPEIAEALISHRFPLSPGSGSLRTSRRSARRRDQGRARAVGDPIMQRTDSTARFPVTPAPPRAGLHLPKVGAAFSLFRDPTAFFERARRSHGETFRLDVLGRPLFCVFSPAGVKELWSLPEGVASKGLADFEMLRHKVPDDLFAGRRTLPHDLFSKDDVSEYLKNVEAAIELELDLLGSSGTFEIFEFMRRFGHRVGLACWGGVTGDATSLLPALCRALDALDSSESFVHPHRALRTVLSGKRAEKKALAELEFLYRRILELRDDAALGRPDLFERIRAVWQDEPSPAREIGIARDVVLVHMGSMSNLFAANAWTLIHLLDRPELLDRIRAGDQALLVRSAHETIRLRQRSIVLRRTLEDFEFNDGERTYRIEAGVFLATTMAVTNTTALPGLGEFDPTNYDGARFVRRAELEAPELVTTFGHGLHSCPAMRFSIVTMQSLISALLERFEFEPRYQNPQPLRRQIGGVARAARACRVTYRRRST